MGDAPVYAGDADPARDSDFAPGELRHLVAGNRGRLLDPRRTPVTVREVAPERGSFVIRVDAFEDAGANWGLGLEEIGRFQFARPATRASDAALGLCRYRGKAPRDPDLYAGSWTRARRAEHLLYRLAFTQELWLRRGRQELTLYRATASDEALQLARPATFVSATFSRPIAGSTRPRPSCSPIRRKPPSSPQCSGGRSGGECRRWFAQGSWR